MKPSGKALRCAVYTRVSTEHGLEQEFNSLDNQREAAAARAGCSPRQVDATISLAFVAPELVKAAIDGRLPCGIGSPN